MPVAPTLLWFRQDLRLADNAALAAALERGRPIIPVYILDDEGEGAWQAGGASRWWLHHSLRALEKSLVSRGSRLVVRRGVSRHVLAELIQDTGADAVFWNRRYEPQIIERDAALKSELQERGILAHSANSALLFEPHTIRNKAGKPFQVFTPFWRHCLTLPIAAEVTVPAGRWAAPGRWPSGPSIDDLRLLPSIPWDREFYSTWTPGEAGAGERLKRFISASMDAYAQRRNEPATDGTSTLSPHLHFGEIGPRQIWAALRQLSNDSGVYPPSAGAAKFMSELGWREFAYHLLFHFPSTPEQPLRSDFAQFPWAEDPDGAKFRAWKRGRTGYPVVDAGMRQLWATGWMHNRVRMIVASFLVKHLRLPWNRGAEWFWDTLVDADLANNTLGWQWSSGCGADAAPYFRVFSPVLQGERFDAQGEYVRRWIPELGRLPNSHIHRPWEAPTEVLARAGVRLGETYPRPIVDHAAARQEALAAFKLLRGEVVERDA